MAKYIGYGAGIYDDTATIQKLREGGTRMNHIVSEWKNDMNRRVYGGILWTIVPTALVLLLMLLSAWCALALFVILPLGVWVIAGAVGSYRRKMAAWHSLSDAERRAVNALCADERQGAYSRLLQGYLTPYGMLLPEGFIPWEGILSVRFLEKGREVSRGTVWLNVISMLLSLIFFLGGEGDPAGEYFDPESPAQCRICAKRNGGTKRVAEYRISLDPQSFAGDGVDCLIAELRACSPVELNIF